MYLRLFCRKNNTKFYNAIEMITVTFGEFTLRKKQYDISEGREMTIFSLESSERHQAIMKNHPAESELVTNH